MHKYFYSMILWLAMSSTGILGAATITFLSQGTAADANESNSLGNTVVIGKNPGWANPMPGSSWVSYANTGNTGSPGFIVPANGLVVSFFENLLLPWSPISAFVTVRADDSAAVYVNNVLVQAEASIPGNTYSTCSDTPISCTVGMEMTLNIASYLKSGANVVRFDVAQRNGSSFGLNYSGLASAPDPDNSTTTPEPATYAMMGVALVAAGMWKSQRKS